MITPELVSYIKDALAKGQSKEVIKQSLVSGGWHDSDLEEAFQSLLVQAVPVPPIPPIGPVNHVEAQIVTQSRSYYWVLGLIGLAVSVVSFLISIPSLSWYLVGGFGLGIGIISSLVLWGISKMFKVTKASFWTALIMIGYAGGIAIIFSFITDIAPILGIVLFLVSILGWLYVFVRIHGVSFMRAFGVGVVDLIVTIIIFIALIFTIGFNVMSSVIPLFNNDQTGIMPTVQTENTSSENDIDTNILVVPVSGYPEKYTNTNLDFTFNHAQAYTVLLLEIIPPPNRPTAMKMATVLLDTQPFPSDVSQISEDRILASHTFMVARNDSNDMLTGSLPGEIVLTRQFQSGIYSCKEYTVTDLKKYVGTICKSGLNSFGYLYPQTSSSLIDLSSVILN